jgi:hypothetical protein
VVVTSWCGWRGVWQDHPVLLQMARLMLQASPHLKEDQHKQQLAELLLDQADLEMFD